MSLSVSSRMARVKPSPTSATLALAAKLRAEGRDIISLGAGEPDFDTPQFIKDAAVRAIEAGETKYTPIDGTPALKAAIQRKFERENGLRYETSQIVVSCGGKQSLFNLCMGLLSAGDEAIIPAPYWVSYPDMVALADGTPVFVGAGIEQDFKITPEQLQDAITTRTRLFFINSPCNPTGASYTKAELEALGEVLEPHSDIVIAADDMYEHIYWHDEPFTSFATACPRLFDRTVTTNGVSKAYAMTGWRIGYAAGPQEIVTAMKTVQSQCTSNPSSVSQAAAVAALDGDQGPVREMAQAYKERHDHVVEALNGIPGFRCRPAEGTFYAFPEVSVAQEAAGLASDGELVEHLINNADVACVPGTAFGAPGYMRLSYACSIKTFDEAVKRIKRALSA